MYMKLKSWAFEKRLWILRISKARHALGFPKLSCAVLEMRCGCFKNLLRSSEKALLVLRILLLKKTKFPKRAAHFMNKVI